MANNIAFIKQLCQVAVDFDLSVVKVGDIIVRRNQPKPPEPKKQAQPLDSFAQFESLSDEQKEVWLLRGRQLKIDTKE